MQLQLPMLTYYAGPTLMDQPVVASAATYRDIVRICWAHRKRTRLTQRALAEEMGDVYASHVSDYLSADPTKRDLPAKHVAAFEVACGNRAITQWFALQANLTILETFIQPQRVAA